MSIVRPVIDASYACASGPKSVGDASPNPSPVIRCRFEVWKKKTNLIFFSSIVFFFLFCSLFCNVGNSLSPVRNAQMCVSYCVIPT
jgi:hypothetical protein